MPFTPEWLSLREPADQAARDPDLIARAAACARSGPRSGQPILDLGSGTGSTARAFAARGFDGLRWRFLDNDASLLDVARQRHPDAEHVLGDLGDVDALPLEGVALVTASALLDLMPRSWVDALALRLRDASVPFYAALSYDGRMTWTPARLEDETITARFNDHQRGDKGSGPALGPDAGAQAAECFRAHGFDVALAHSPWRIGPDQPELHAALLDGIGAAAAEAGHDAARDWTQARRALVAQSGVVIGHADMLAVPAEEQP